MKSTGSTKRTMMLAIIALILLDIALPIRWAWHFYGTVNKETLHINHETNYLNDYVRGAEEMKNNPAVWNAQYAAAISAVPTTPAIGALISTLTNDATKSGVSWKTGQVQVLATPVPAGSPPQKPPSLVNQLTPTKAKPFAISLSVEGTAAQVVAFVDSLNAPPASTNPNAIPATGRLFQVQSVSLPNVGSAVVGQSTAAANSSSITVLAFTTTVPQFNVPAPLGNGAGVGNNQVSVPGAASGGTGT